MGNKLFFVIIVTVIFCLPGLSQEKQKMNISQLLDYAQQNSYRIKEARLNILKSKSLVKEVRADGLPKIDALIEHKDYLKRPTMILPGALTGNPLAPDIETQFGKKYNMDMGVQVSQLLFSLQYIYGLKTAKKSKEIIELQEAKTGLDLIHNLYSEYYNLLAIYKNLEIIESNMESLQQTRQKTSALVSADLALQTDLDRIDVNLANLKASITQVNSAIKVQTNNIKYIAGMEDVEILIDTTDFHLMFSDPFIVEKHSKEQVRLEERVEIKMLDKNIELNDLQIKSAKAALAPNLAAFGSYVYQAQRDRFDLFEGNSDWFNISLIGFKANIPIFSGKKNKANISQTKIEREITLNKRNEALEGMKVEYLNALSQYQVSIDNCKTQLKNISLARNVKMQEELKYNEGLSTLTDYLISETVLRNAEIDYVKSYLVMKQSELDLLRSKGKLTQF